MTAQALWVYGGSVLNHLRNDIGRLVYAGASARGRKHPLTVVGVSDAEVLFEGVLYASAQTVEGEVLILFFPLEVLLVVVHGVLLEARQSVSPVAERLVTGGRHNKPRDFCALIACHAELLLPASSRSSVNR